MISSSLLFVATPRHSTSMYLSHTRCTVATYCIHKSSQGSAGWQRCMKQTQRCRNRQRCLNRQRCWNRHKSVWNRHKGVGNRHVCFVGHNSWRRKKERKGDADVHAWMHILLCVYRHICVMYMCIHLYICTHICKCTCTSAIHLKTSQRERMYTHT